MGECRTELSFPDLITNRGDSVSLKRLSCPIWLKKISHLGQIRRRSEKGGFELGHNGVYQPEADPSTSLRTGGDRRYRLQGYDGYHGGIGTDPLNPNPVNLVNPVQYSSRL